MAAGSASIADDEVVAPAPTRRRPGALRRLRGDVKGRVGLVTLAILLVALFIGPLVFGVDPMYQDLRARLVAPGMPGHPLGTDQLGRDMLARLLVGGQLSLTIGLSASVLAAV